MHEMSEGVKGPGQDMAGCGETNSSESESLGEEMRKDMAGHGETNSYESLSEETLDQNDFANPPSKKLKCLQSSVLDDQFPSQAISSSLISECPDSLSSELDVEPLESSPLQPKRIVNSVTYDHIPQDYTLTELDCCAQCVIQNAKEDDILVQIDEISIKKRFLKCLLDENKWLDDEVISAYICCLKEQAHVQNQNDSKVYYENPFVTRLLKQDGQSGIDGPTGMTKVVKNYMNHDMVHLPINIIDSHWYLATLNFEKCEFQVLDSLCWKHNRVDLIYTI